MRAVRSSLSLVVIGSVTAMFTTACGASTVPTRPTAAVCSAMIHAEAQSPLYRGSRLFKQAEFVLIHGCQAIATRHGMGARITETQARSLALDYLAASGIISDTTSTAAPPTTTPTASATATAPTPSISTYGGTAQFVQIGPPTDQTACSDSLLVGQHTSCPFAANVYGLVKRGYIATGHVPGYVIAFSPVTRETYRLNCTRVAAGSEVVCVTQDDAEVAFELSTL
jgi:hypothetical protein